MRLEVDNYRIEIFLDNGFTKEPADHIQKYDIICLDVNDQKFTTVIGIIVYQNDKKLKSAAIGANGRASELFEHSYLVDNDRILICCSNTIFCLSFPELMLIWKKQADYLTCYKILQYKDSYIIHGELSISRLDKLGNILWQQKDSEIFTTLKRIDDFRIMDEFILAKVWGHRTFKIDFNGNRII